MVLRRLRMCCGRLRSSRHHFVGVVMSRHDSILIWTVIVGESWVIILNIIIYRATFAMQSTINRPPMVYSYIGSSDIPLLLGRYFIFSFKNKQIIGTSQATLLQSVLEAWLALNHLATSINTLVGSPELVGECEGDEDDHAVGDHAGHDSWTVTWGIDLTEDSCERVSLCSLCERG